MYAKNSGGFPAVRKRFRERVKAKSDLLGMIKEEGSNQGSRVRLKSEEGREGENAVSPADLLNMPEVQTYS